MKIIRNSRVKNSNLSDKSIYNVDWDGSQPAIYIKTNDENKLGYLFVSLASDRGDDERLIRVPKDKLSNFIIA